MKESGGGGGGVETDGDAADGGGRVDLDDGRVRKVIEDILHDFLCYFHNLGILVFFHRGRQAKFLAALEPSFKFRLKCLHCWNGLSFLKITIL